METLSGDSTVFGSCNLAQESPDKSSLNQEEMVASALGQDSNGVVIKCSALVADETELKKLPFVDGNNVLGADQNGSNGVVKSVDTEGLHEEAALQSKGGDSATNTEALAAEVHGLSNGDAKDSEVVEVQFKVDEDTTSGIEVEVVNNGGLKELLEVNHTVCLENEENPGVEADERPETMKNYIAACAEQKEVQEEEQDEHEEEEGDEDEDNQDHKFSVGEFVWAKTLHRPWWPGQIYDPSDASKEIAMYYRKDRILVTFFADETSAWCYPSLVKPFQKKFREMSRQGSSSSFHNAVEEALSRISRCVKSEMTCSCAPPEIQTKFARPLASSSGIRKGVVVPDGRVIGLSVTDFEPAKFLTGLKCIAEVVSEIGLLERIVLQSQLSAFNQAKGWCQLHIYLKLLASSNRRANVGYATKNDFECFGTTGEQLVRAFQADCPSSTISNVFGRISSAEKKYQKTWRNTIGHFSLSSRKSKRNTDFEGGINGILAEDGSSSRKSASSSKEQEKAKPSGSPFEFSDSNDLTLENDDVETKEGNTTGFLSRERKKSKYLSPPYTFLSPEDKMLMSLKDSVPTSPKVPRVSDENKYLDTTEGLIKCSGGTIRKKQSDGKKIETNFDASEILPEFYSAAVDSMYLEESTKYDWVKEFLLRLRRFRHESDHQILITDPSSPRKVMHKTDCPTNERGAERRERMEDAMPRSRQRECLDITAGLPRDDTHKTVQATSLRGTERNVEKRTENATSRSPSNKSLSSALPLSGEDLHEVGFQIPSGGTKRKARNWKEDARSQIPKRKPVDIPFPTSEGGGLESKGRNWKEDARAKITPVNGPPKKRGRKRKQDGLSGSIQINLEQATSFSNRKTHQANGETSSTALLLKFGPGVPLPTKEDLTKLFGRFGALNELETEVKKDSNCAQVVYTSRTNAEEAFNSSQKISPFGPAVVNYQLQSCPSNSRVSKAKLNLKQLIPSSIGGNALIPLSSLPSSAEAPPLQYVKQNLENMTSMLEKAGDKLPPEVKVNLESEIRKLLKKVETMA